MSNPTPFNASASVDPDDLDKNNSANPSLHDLLAARLHRRHVLGGGIGAMTMAGFGSMSLAACSGGSVTASPALLPTLPVPVAVTLGFTAVNKGKLDRVTVPAGYTATVIYATGDSIDAAVPDYLNNGSQDNFARRSGDHHDGMHFFGLSASAHQRPPATTAPCWS